MTSENNSPQYRTFAPRLWAGLFDLHLLVLLATANSVLFYSDIPKLLWVVCYTLLVFAWPAYRVLMHTLWGQTLGKMVTRVKVIGIEGKKFTLLSALRRESPQIIAQFIGYLFLSRQILQHSQPEYLWYGFENIRTFTWMIEISATWSLPLLLVTLGRDRYQGVHDWLGNSLVIRTESHSDVGAATNLSRKIAVTLLWLGLGLFLAQMDGIRDYAQNPPRDFDLSLYDFRIVPGSAAHSEENIHSLTFDLEVTPPIHGRYYVSAYVATDPEFENQIGVWGTSVTSRNPWSLFSEQKIYPWYVELDWEKLDTLPQPVYLRVDLSSRLNVKSTPVYEFIVRI